MGLVAPSSTGDSFLLDSMIAAKTCSLVTSLSRRLFSGSLYGLLDAGREELKPYLFFKAEMRFSSYPSNIGATLFRLCPHSRFVQSGLSMPLVIAPVLAMLYAETLSKKME